MEYENLLKADEPVGEKETILEAAKKTEATGGQKFLHRRSSQGTPNYYEGNITAFTNAFQNAKIKTPINPRINQLKSFQSQENFPRKKRFRTQSESVVGTQRYEKVGPELVMNTSFKVQTITRSIRDFPEIYGSYRSLQKYEIRRESLNLLGYPKEEDEEEVEEESITSYFRQISLVCVVGMCGIPLGIVIGWSAILPKIQADSSLDFNITHDDVKWLVSSIYITAILGNLTGGAIGQLIGPRRFLLILLPICIASWGALAMGHSLVFIYIPRIFIGFLYGIFNTLIQPLVSEIAEPRIRGLANCLPEMIISGFILYTYVLAHFLPWRIATAMCAAPLIPTFVLMFFVPESPYWLMRNGKVAETSKALDRILGPTRKASKPIIIKEIQLSLENQAQSSVFDQIRLLRHAQNWKPLLLVCVIIIMRELTGKVGVFMYTVYIFQMAEVAIDPFLCTIMVGVTRFLCNFLTIGIIDRFGRKTLLVVTILVCAVSLAVAGAVLLTDQDFPGGKMVPLVCVLLFTVAYSSGVSPVPWALMGELLPTPVRGISSSIVCVCFSGSIFVMTNTFPTMLHDIGLAWTFLLFSVCTLFLAAVVMIFLPETKGRTLLELESIFAGKPVKEDVLLKGGKKELSSNEV